MSRVLLAIIIIHEYSLKKIVLLHDRSLGYLNGVVIFYTANVVKSVWHVNLFRGTIGANSSRKKSNDCYLFAMRVLGQGRTNNCNSEVDILFGYTHWGLNTHYLRQKKYLKMSEFKHNNY